jgi:hypothetical protein
MKVLWAVKKGNPDWQEELISVNPANFEYARRMASLDGYDKFRIAEIGTDIPDLTRH